MSTRLSRRGFLRAAGAGSLGILLAACEPQEVTTLVEKEVTKLVEVEKEVEVTKEVTTVVKEEVTKVVEKVVTATPAGPIRLTFSVTEQANQAHEPWRMLFYERWQDATNIKIDFRSQGLGVNYTEKMNLLLAADDAPDFFIATTGSLKQVMDSSLLPLDDLIAEHAPNFQSLVEEYKATSFQLKAPDGHIYGMPDYVWHYPMGNFYRKDLADKAGLGDLKTVDDWYTYLVEAKKQDSVAQGFGRRGGLFAGIAYVFRGAFGMEDEVDGWHTRRGDTFINGLLEPEGKACIELVRKWWADGVIHPEAAVAYANYWESWAQGTTIATIGEYFNANNMIDKANKAGTNWSINIVDGPTGSQGQCRAPNYTGWDGWAYALGRNNPNPVATVEAIDWMFSEEGQKLWAVGVEGETYTVNSDGCYEFTPEALAEAQKAGEEAGQGVQWGMQKVYGVGLNGIMGRYRPVWNGMQCSQKAFSTDPAVYQAQFEDSVNWLATKYPTPNFTEEETEERRTISADLDTYQSEQLSKMAAGDTSMDTWDDFVAQSKKMGSERLTEILNTAYDRTMKEADLA